VSVIKILTISPNTPNTSPRDSPIHPEIIGGKPKLTIKSGKSSISNPETGTGIGEIANEGKRRVNLGTLSLALLNLMHQYIKEIQDRFNRLIRTIPFRKTRVSSH
jgi:hypothetical protein